jgi:CRP-like cAMP-binding protein
MEVLQMFGEMSILGSQQTSVSIVANSDVVELYVIELELVYDLFVNR